MNKEKIVVCGAKGYQCGAVIKELLKRVKFEVVALSKKAKCCYIALPA